MTSTPSTRRAPATIITPIGRIRPAGGPLSPGPRPRPRPASPGHRALEARLVGCFG